MDASDPMPRIFSHRFTVPDDVIDVNRHVNNLAYLRWMLDVAIAHSTAQGWPMERYLALGQAWVVRSHGIEYLRPALAGEELLLLTWVEDMQRRSSRRRYLFFRPADGAVLARADTQWVFVDGATGRPVGIPDQLREAFEPVPPGEAVLETLGLVPVAPQAAP